MGSLSLGETSRFNGVVTFDVGLIPYLLQIFLMLLHKPWVLGMTIWPFVFTSLVVGWAPAVPWLLATLLTSLVGLVSFFSTLSKAHLGYLQWASAFLRCSISFWSSSGLLQTVFALWVRVFIALYLAERWWWLSHCRYWSMWVGFLYTVIDSLPSASGLTCSIQEGDETILLVVFHCKLYGWVNTINVLKEVFISSLWTTQVPYMG